MKIVYKQTKIYPFAFTLQKRMNQCIKKIIIDLNNGQFRTLPFLFIAVEKKYNLWMHF
jgi:hypothetical protein